MVHLELNELEAELVREIAEEWLSDLRTEIAGTDRADYREVLKRKEELLRELLTRLRALVA